MSEQQKGLRARLDEEADRRKEQAEELKKIREELEKLREEGVSGKLEATRLDMRSLRKTAAKVAKTFQERGKDLRTIDKAGDKAEELMSEVRKIKMRTRIEGGLMVVLGVLLTLLILWSTTTLSLYTLPRAWRMTEAEQEAMRELRTIERATGAMTDQQAKTYQELIEEGLSQAEAKDESSQSDR